MKPAGFLLAPPRKIVLSIKEAFLKLRLVPSIQKGASVQTSCTKSDPVEAPDAS
jgi:hypothetical protein